MEQTTQNCKGICKDCGDILNKIHDLERQVIELHLKIIKMNHKEGDNKPPSID